MKNLYDKMMEACKTNDDQMIEGTAINLLSKNTENPFKTDTAEHDLFYKMTRAYRHWINREINYRRSKVQIGEYAKQIADLNIPNPYEIKEEPKDEKETIHILGVLPNEKEAQTEKKSPKKVAKPLNEK